MSDTADRVKKIVVEHLGVDEDKVVDNASFIDDLGADSLDTVELVMAFEEEFGIEIPDDAAETYKHLEMLLSSSEMLLKLNNQNSKTLAWRRVFLFVSSL